MPDFNDKQEPAKIPGYPITRGMEEQRWAVYTARVQIIVRNIDGKSNGRGWCAVTATDEGMTIRTAGINKEKKGNEKSHRVSRPTFSVKQNNTNNGSPKSWPLYRAEGMGSQYQNKQTFVLARITTQWNELKH